MKFLIQKINKEIRHDFAFTLLESIRFDKWLYGKNSTMKYQFLNTIEIVEPDDIYPPFEFKPSHKDYVPIGSVEFVTEFLQHFYGITPLPQNVPGVLIPYAGRDVWICSIGTLSCFKNGKYFIKSATKIKGYSSIITKTEEYFEPNIPIDDYQVSEIISIDSEWRAFVFENKLVGLQNYGGDFRIFPNVSQINKMIGEYNFHNRAPIAYTLDVAVNNDGTFIIEVHDFFSCGLYGFADHSILPYMFYRWFKSYIKSNTN